MENVSGRHAGAIQYQVQFELAEHSRSPLSILNQSASQNGQCSRHSIRMVAHKCTNRAIDAEL
jgi:hypothetical protein